MKQVFLFCSLLLLALSTSAQNRNLTVKALNNYLKYSNANTTALQAATNTLASYNSLFNGYLRKNRKLGGEDYEKPKPSPFVDEDVFTLNEDNPDYLYSVALKESSALPATVKTELNRSIKSIHACSQKIVKLLDSMSNIFSGPLIAVTNNETILPYNLLAEAKRQLQQSKKYRDELVGSITLYYNTTCSLTPGDAEYMHSVAPLRKGLEICQSMMNDLNRNDSSHIARYVHSLDSLHVFLDRSELTLMKGIAPIGRSRNFPITGNPNGFDLYAKYEDLLDELSVFSALGKKFLANASGKYPNGRCYYFHTECTTRFNSVLGLVYYYNEYVLLIGGGKMKIESEVGTLMKGWGDEKHSLPLKALLLWVKETPQFEIDWTN